MKNRKNNAFRLLVCISIWFLPNLLTAQCLGPNPSLGNDTTFCAGQSLMLNPGSFSTYLWNNGSTQATQTVSQPGEYSVIVGITGTNVILNGDFEAGNTGFSTDYAVGVGGGYGLLSLEGTYVISTSPSLAHDNFVSCQDHTPNPGSQMMIVNGSSTANTNVWCQTVPVNPNTDYNFGTWVSNALNDNNLAQLQFSINGSNIGTVFSPLPTGCDWVQFQQQWSSGINVSAQICIKNQSTMVSGNDFMIDDITFSPICYKYDTILIANNPIPVITATPNDTICLGDISSISASSLIPNLNYTWNPGLINSPNLNVSPTTTTIYNVTATDQNNCVSNLISRTVVVLTPPTVNIIITDTLICEGFSVFMSAMSAAANLSYQWTPNIGSVASVSDVPLTSTNYTLIIQTPNGCLGYDTVFVNVIPALDVNISGDLSICDGESSTLSVTGNVPNMVFLWSDGTQGAQTQVTPFNNQQIIVTGSYFVCADAFDTVNIQVNDFPSISISEDVAVCPGETVLSAASSNISGATIHWTPSNVTGSSISTEATVTNYVYAYADNNGCVSAIDSMLIDVSAACFVDVPNVFTPNSDGSNDFFSLISFDGITSLNCVILNRWGIVLKEFDTPNFTWDGTDLGGLPLEEGVYFYKIDGITTANEAFEKQGFVHLVRSK